MFYNHYLITKIDGRQILDSRGNPTLEAEIRLSDGTKAFASVPSGASTGRFEARELRDRDLSFYSGCGVTEAAKNVCGIISETLVGKDASQQRQIDNLLRSLDPNDNLENLGANSALAVSLAAARACAKSQKTPLYRYLGGVNATTLPVPMMNILNGGVHASSSLDIQEFMIMPAGFISFRDALRCGCEIYQALRMLLKQKGLSSAVGDEGGFAPNLRCDSDAIEMILTAIESAGYKPGKQVYIALDAAASQWENDGKYFLPKQKCSFSPEKLLMFWKELCEKYPIISIEDPFGEEDFESTALLTKELGSKVQIVGDDLFVTDKKRVAHGISVKAANAVLIKPNQIGTLSDALETVAFSKYSGYGTIISHRSGETEDTFIADLAVALNAGQIKTGAPCRTDRVCKYNRLLRIEEELGDGAVYFGKNVVK